MARLKFPRLKFHASQLLSSYKLILSLYGLVVILFSLAFYFGEYVTGHEGKFLSGVESYIDYLYFTVVTITTLGYGDIQPVHDIAKILVMVLTLSGLFLMGLLISSMFHQIISVEKNKAELSRAFDRFHEMLLLTEILCQNLYFIGFYRHNSVREFLANPSEASRCRIRDFLGSKDPMSRLRKVVTTYEYIFSNSEINEVHYISNDCVNVIRSLDRLDKYLGKENAHYLKDGYHYPKIINALSVTANAIKDLDKSIVAAYKSNGIPVRRLVDGWPPEEFSHDH